MHVLTIPSWYPLDDEDLNGIFFKEYVKMHNQSGHTSGLIAPQLIPYRSKQFKNLRTLLGKKTDTGVLPSIRFISPNIPRRLKIYYYRICGLGLYREYVRLFGKPDVIHAHSAIWGGYIANVIKRLYGVPYIITEHNSRFVGNGEVPHDEMRFIPRILDESDFAVGVSDFMADAISKLSNSSKEILSIPNPVSFNGKYTDKLERKGIISVCHLNKNKRIDLLIRAYAKSKVSESENLYIIGDGVERNNLIKLAESLRIADKIFFMGSMNNSEVHSFMQTGSFFISTSRFETFGIAIVEALMAGMPVISTPSGGSKGSINLSNGIYLTDDSIESLSLAMDQIYSKIEEYDRETISNTAKLGYSYESTADIYNTLLIEAAKK